MKHRLPALPALLALLALLPVAHPQETDGFDTRLNAGFTLTDGNSDTTLLTLGAETKYARETREFLASARYEYGRATVENADGAETDRTHVDTAGAEAQGNAFFSEKSYGFVNARAERDEIADLDYRLLGGPGLGRYLVRNDVWNLSVEAGLVYVTEKEGGDEENYAACRLAQRYERDLNDTARVWQSLEFMPQVEDAELYLLNAEIGLESKLGAKLGLRVTAVNKYDSDPADDAEENDLTVTAGFSYAL